MNKDINLMNILKNVSKGTKLWSPLYGECLFIRINKQSIYPIICRIENTDGARYHVRFTYDGKSAISKYYKNTGCILFPSSTNKDWSTFNVANHKIFKPFQKVLVKVMNEYGNHVWFVAIYSHYNESKGRHYFSNLQWTDDDSGIIPFEGNEDKLGQIAE